MFHVSIIGIYQLMRPQIGTPGDFCDLWTSNVMFYRLLRICESFFLELWRTERAGPFRLPCVVLIQCVPLMQTPTNSWALR